MEALADFGTVDLLGVQALTSAIYRVWNGAFDQAAALQLATVLLASPSSWSPSSGLLRGPGPLPPGARPGRRRRAPAAPRLAAAGSPPSPGCGAARRRVRAAGRAARRLVGRDRRRRHRRRRPRAGGAEHRCCSASSPRWSPSPPATVVVYGAAGTRPSRPGALVARLATLGYAVPGTVVAVAVYVPLVWIDRRLVDVADALLGRDVGLLFTGTILGLVIAYLVRFHALAFLADRVPHERGSAPTSTTPPARSAPTAPACSPTSTCRCSGPGMLTAALLVLVEVMKELPATALLRPLGRDTLAITVWEATKDSRLDAAALPALLIVAGRAAPGGPARPPAAGRGLDARPPTRSATSNPRRRRRCPTRSGRTLRRDLPAGWRPESLGNLGRQRVGHGLRLFRGAGDGRRRVGTVGDVGGELPAAVGEDAGSF